MNKASETFLVKLLEAPSPSGYEQPAARIWREYVKKHVDQLIPDVHGNSIAVLNPKAKFTFVLAGHIDEIGLMITYIDDKGYIYTAQIGGMDPALLVGQRVKIMTQKGEVFGVIGRKAIHLMKPEERKKGVDMENIWVDIGADSKKAAEKRVCVGDPIVVDVPCRSLDNDKLVSRATDDKTGAFVVAEVMKALSKRQLNICVMGVATVQEEVGLRGAITSSYRVNPDAGFALDVTFASDHPETDPKKIGVVALGKGPFFDPRNEILLDQEIIMVRNLVAQLPAPETAWELGPYFYSRAHGILGGMMVVWTMVVDGQGLWRMEGRRVVKVQLEE